MRNGRGTTLLTAFFIILLCIALIIGGMLAVGIFEASVENHLLAGKLSVKLERVSLTKTYLDDKTGYLVTSVPNTSVVDFSKSNVQQQNVFDIAEHEVIVPGCAYEATLRLTNNGDVAFSYDVIIKLTSESNSLAQQMKVFVNGVDGGYLSEFERNGEAVISSQTMSKTDKSQEFTVKVLFADLASNNAAQDQKVSFDLMVSAVQLLTSQFA